jgi:hypothetical protein
MSPDLPNPDAVYHTRQEAAILHESNFTMKLLYASHALAWLAAAQA